MSTADVLAYESVHTSQFSTPHSRNISAYSQEDDFEAVVSAVEQYIGHDISDAHARTIPVDQFLLGLGAEPGEVEGGDARLTDIAKSQEVVDLRDEYCAEMSLEVQRYGPFCNLANHIIQQFEGTNILFVRNDPKVIDGVCKSKRKPDIIGIRDGHVSVVGGLWKNYNDRGPPVITGSSQRGESSREGKGKAGDKKKVAKHFVPWGWKDIQYVAEFKKQRYVIDLHRLAIARTKRKSRSGKASGHAGSSETKRRTSSPHMMQSESSSKVPSSESAKRKLMEELQEEEGRDYVKRQRQSANDVRYDLQLGGAKYAVDQLSALTHRRHVIEFLVIDGVLVLAYYDRGGPVYSEDLSFVEDLYRFSLLIKLLATRDPWQRGFLERLVDVTSLSIGDGSSHASTTEEGKGQDLDANALRTGSSTLVSPSGGLEQSGQICMNEGFGDESEPVPPLTPPIDSQQLAEVTVPVGDKEGSAAIVVPTSKPPGPAIEPKLGKHRYDLKLSRHTVRLHDLCGKRPPYGLISRGSSVFRSKCETLDGPPSGVCATKISWPLARRRSEATILREARDILRWMDVNPAQKEKYGYGNRKLEDCLPFVYLDEDIDDLQKENSFRWRIITFFGDVFKLANRICRAIVMECFVPLWCVENLDHFKQAIRDIVLVHHLLASSESHILHRDISADNLMVRYYDSKTICGVLIDFDLAVTSREATEDHTGTRTGTRPFMAWQLLESDPPPIHLERFDWESFFYVICWIGCRYSEGKEVNKSFLSRWYNADDESLIDAKRRWLQEPKGFTSFYVPVARDWVVDLATMFEEGAKKRAVIKVAELLVRPEDPISDEEFDEETSGGSITWDRFWGILKK